MAVILDFDARYAAYIEAELRRILFECKQDAYERQNAERLPPLVPQHQYDTARSGRVMVVLNPVVV